MTGAGPPDPDDWAWWRRQWLALMLSVTFAAGALFGVLMSALAVPAVWTAPCLLAVSGLFFVYMMRKD